MHLTRNVFRRLTSAQPAWRVVCSLLLSVVAPAAQAQVHQETAHMEIALRVLSTTPLIDGHNDLAWEIRTNEAAPMDVRAYGMEGRAGGHTDIPRLREGRVGGQFWSVYVPVQYMEQGVAAQTQREQIGIALELFREYPEYFELARTADDVVRIFREGRVASILGMEGGHVIENSLSLLRSFHDLGARYMTLTHSTSIDWADSSEGPVISGGLSGFGREVVREMNRLGMLVDLSHVSEDTMSDALEVAEAPVIFSHSSARTLTEHHRNVPDTILRRLPENGGVVMIAFYPPFVRQQGRARLSDVADHIEYVKELIGIDHVGLGSDFDGIGTTVVEGLEDVSTFPALFAELSRRGWAESELKKLAGENILRVMREAEAVASRLEAERPSFNVTIDQINNR